MQKCLGHADAYRKKTDLTLTSNKAGSLVYGPDRCLLPTRARLFLIDEPIPRVRSLIYLGLLIDDRVTWRPAVKTTLLRCLHQLLTLRSSQGKGWGNSQQSMLHLYRSFIFSRLLYALFLMSTASSQWELLETFHRLALTICLGVPSNAPNIPTLIEAEYIPLYLQAEECAMWHLEHLHRASSGTLLLKWLLDRPGCWIGSLLRSFHVASVDQVSYFRICFPWFKGDISYVSGI